MFCVSTMFNFPKSSSNSSFETGLVYRAARAICLFGEITKSLRQFREITNNTSLVILPRDIPIFGFHYPIHIVFAILCNSHSLLSFIKI